MFSVSKKGRKFSRSSSRHGCKLIVSSFLSLSKRKKKEMVADAWRPDSAGFLCCKFVCGFHLLERLLKVHANWLFVAANSSFFDERAFWIRCNFVFHEILFSLSFLAEFQRNLRQRWILVVTLEIFRENRRDLSSNDESCRDKIPFPRYFIAFQVQFVSCTVECMNFRAAKAIMTVDKTETCLRFEGLEEMTGK